MASTDLDEVMHALHASGAEQSGRVAKTWTAAVDRTIGRIVDPLAAALILIEVALLSTGVFTRYVLKDAIVWGDELAKVLFLWLTMLGAVSAYRRGEHMRLTTFVRHLSPARAAFCDVVVTVLITLFALQLLAAIVWPSFIPDTIGTNNLLASMRSGEFFSGSYLGQEATDILPAMQIPRTVAVMGIVVGLLLILAISLLRLCESRSSAVWKAVGGIVLVCGAAYLGKPGLAELGNFNLVLFFVVCVAAQIVIGVPIAFAFGISTLSYLALATELPLSVVAGQMDEGMSNAVLLAIPLFVLLGLLIEATGIAQRLVAAIAAFVGHLSGGLNIVLVVAMFLVSGISGSKLADMAAVTPILFPEMAKRGYKRSEMIALLSTSGAMAELIPPSLVLIIIGTVCSLSIQSLFTGGLLPATLTAAALIVVSRLRSYRQRQSPMPRMSYPARWRALWAALPGLVLPVVIRYFVVAGIATATEVSTVGVLYALVVGGLVYREFDWRRGYPMLCETARLTGAIMLIIAMATAMGWALTQSGFATKLAVVLDHAPGGVAGFVALSIILFIVLGSVLEGIPAIVLFGPLLFPIAHNLGMNEIHYAIIAVLSMSIGLFAPPFGVGYYGACAVGKCDPDEAAVAIVPYVLALLASLIVIAAIPWLTVGLL
jgi:tripartite ATP-independent transporter DctM subunit